jgi:PAS domain S-box-containing protein
LRSAAQSQLDEIASLPLGFDIVEAALVVTDTRLRIIGWNRGAELTYGWNADDAIGRDPCDLFVPAEHRTTYADILAGVATGESWSGNLPSRRADGSDFLARGTQSALTDQHGNVVAYLGLMFPTSGGQFGSTESPESVSGLSLPEPADRATILVLPQARRAFVGSVELRLTDSEFAVLQLLETERGRVVDDDEIAEVVWGYPTAGSRNFVQAHVSRLRRKLRAAGVDDLIKTVRGVGYFIDV